LSAQLDLKAKCRGGRFNQGGDVTLLGGGKFSSEGAVFLAANLAPGAILFYQRGDILRGAMLFCDTGTSRRDYGRP